MQKYVLVPISDKPNESSGCFGFIVLVLIVVGVLYYFLPDSDNPSKRVATKPQQKHQTKAVTVSRVVKVVDDYTPSIEAEEVEDDVSILEPSEKEPDVRTPEELLEQGMSIREVSEFTGYRKKDLRKMRRQLRREQE